MISNKKSVIGTSLAVFFVIVSVAICLFSVSEAAETEGENPVPNAGPLTVLNSAGNPASEAECEWDPGSSIYSINADGLTFIGTDDVLPCGIMMGANVEISTVTFNNVKLTKNNDWAIVDLVSNGDLTINIENDCSFSNTAEWGFFFPNPYGFNATSNSYDGTFTLNGGSSSHLEASSNGSSAICIQGYITDKITGDLSITATAQNTNASASGDAYTTTSDFLIFDTSGNIVLTSKNNGNGHNAIEGWGYYDGFKLTVNKGNVELHAPNIAENSCGAIMSINTDPSTAIELGEDVKMVGAQSPTATLEECKEGVSMQYYGSGEGFYLSSIDDAAAGTVFFTWDAPGPGPGPEPGPEPEPTPSPGIETYDAVQTGDNIPSAAIALLAIVALGSFVVLRSRKVNF